MTSLDLFTLTAPTTLGQFRLIASDLGLRNVCWPNQSFPLSPIPARRDKPPDFLQATARQLADYFGARKVCFTAPLDLTPLTPFARRVLTALAHLPHGQTITYSQLAAQAGSPKAARAVGTVLARNPLPIVIPCHRVLTAAGTLGGFSAPAGTTLKQRLLDMENIEL